MRETTSRRGTLRSGLAVLGAATLLVVGADMISFAATGDSVILGKTNKASKTTTIQNTGNGPALKLKTKKSKPPLSVTSKKLVKKLNADMVDGKTLDQIAPTVWRTSLGTSGAMADTMTPVETTSLPAGTYQMHLGGIVSPDTGSGALCIFIDYTRLAANPSDYGAYYLYGLVNDDELQMSGNLVAAIPAGHRMVFICQGGSNDLIVQPFQLTLEKVDRTAAVPGVHPFVPRPDHPVKPLN